VNFNKPNALEDYIKINIIVAYIKLLKYYSKLNNLLAYYTLTILYPYYKYYFKNV
ncbi:hypothetical protein K458DRAFT_315676, partial [Lentithecium fluviatile CBS 122367]